VSSVVVGRSAEFRAIAAFFDSLYDRPAGLLIEGEAGIGKTTLWLAALEEARMRGFRVLSARAWEAESVLAYGTVADLLNDVNTEVLNRLPEVQRLRSTEFGCGKPTMDRSPTSVWSPQR